MNTDARDQLLAHFLARDEKTRDGISQLEQKRLEIELRKTELEWEHLEAKREQDRIDIRERQQLREQRREHAASMREARARKQASANGKANEPCNVCRNSSDPRLTASEIMRHYSEGHNGAAVPLENEVRKVLH